MSSLANPTLFAAGIALVLIGIWLWRVSARMVIDVTGAALGEAWQSVRGRRMPGMPDEIKSRLNEVTGEQSHVRKASKVASIGMRHYVGRFIGILSFIALLGGLGLAAAGIWWR